jgi:hypothetical protein
MIRQKINCVFNIALCLYFAVGFGAPLARAQQSGSLSGRDSPVHDSDRMIPLSGKTISLEDDEVRVTFDGVSGALLGLTNKKTGWNVEGAPELGKSFRIFAPTAERSYNPVLGARNKLALITKSSDGHSLTMVWHSLEGEYRGTLDITLTGTVTLDGPDLDFDMEVTCCSHRQHAPAANYRNSETICAGSRREPSMDQPGEAEPTSLPRCRSGADPLSGCSPGAIGARCGLTQMWSRKQNSVESLPEVGDPHAHMLQQAVRKMDRHSLPLLVLGYYNVAPKSLSSTSIISSNTSS